MGLSCNHCVCIQHILLTLQPNLSSAHSLNSVCSCVSDSQALLMLSFPHPETDLGLHVAGCVPPSPAIVTVWRHERGSYPPEIYSECEHPSTL